MSHCGSLKNNDVLPLDIESTEVKGHHVSCIQNTFCHYMPVKQEFSCYLGFEPSVLLKTSYKAVVNLKHRIHEFMITQGEIITPTLNFCSVWLCGPVSNTHVVM